MWHPSTTVWRQNTKHLPRFEDIHNAISYLCKHADELNILIPINFVLLGRSAGAQIALLAAYTLHDPHVKGVIDFYGPADMVWGYSIPSNPLIMDSRKVMDELYRRPLSAGAAKVCSLFAAGVC